VHNDDTWIARAYDAGAKGCFDVLATHPYTAPADVGPLPRDNGSMYSFRHVTAVRDVMVQNGDRHKNIWFTELGWSSHANTGSEANWNRGVTEAQQARYAVESLRLIRDEYPYVKKAFWYNERNKSTGDIHQDNFGLLRRDASPKPAWYAIRNYLLG
jgi:hypothetical protein